jgi:hypothetical protein
MKQSLCLEANSRSPSQGIFRLLYSPKFDNHIGKSPTFIIIVSHMDPLRIFTDYLFKIHFNIILYINYYPIY